MSKENEKRRDGSMDLWPGRRDGERWASAPGAGILPLSKSGMSESSAEKMGFFCRCDRQVPRKSALAGLPLKVGSLPAGRQEGAQYRRKLPYREAKPFRAWLHSLHAGGLGGMKDGCLTLNERV
jgi:hypothetical protein